MAETLGTYYFQVAPSSDGIGKELENALNGAGGSAGGVADILSGGFSAALGVAGTAIAGVTTAVTAMAGAVTAAGEALLDSVAATAEYGDNIDKMSQKMGISAEAYQEWEAVMQHSGTSMETLKASMKTMAAAAQSGNEAFQALGITEEQIATLSQEDLFDAVISGLQDMEEGTERTYIASQLLGRGATELGALLNTSAEDTQAMKDRLHELGGVMSDEDVKAAAAFEDSLQDMTTGFEALQRNLVGGFMPSMTKVMDGVSDIFAGDPEKGMEAISDGVKGFADNLKTLVPNILSIGGDIVGTLAQSILANAPMLIEVGSQQLLELMRGFVEAAPSTLASVSEVIHTLLETAKTFLPEFLLLASELMRTIAKSLGDELPTIIPLITEIAVSLIDTFLQVFVENQQVGADLIGALAEGCLKALPILIGVIPTLISAFVQIIIGNMTAIMNAGTQLLTALVSDGNLETIISALLLCIPDIIDALITAFTTAIPLFISTGFDLFVALLGDSVLISANLCGVVVEIIDSILQKIADMIVDFEDIGGQIMQGLADGIVKAGDKVVQTAKDVLGQIPQGAKDLFQINSPSKLFEDYGQYIDEGLAIGISANADLPEDAMVSMSGDVATSYAPYTEQSASTPTEGGGSGDVTVIQPIYIGQDKLDELVFKATNRMNYVSGGH